jgi:hypothetical protein
MWGEHVVQEIWFVHHVIHDMQGIMRLVLSHQVQIMLQHQFASTVGRILSCFKGHTDGLLDHKMQENFVHYFPGKEWSHKYGIFLCKVGFRKKYSVHDPHPVQWSKTWLWRDIQIGVFYWNGLKIDVRTINQIIYAHIVKSVLYEDNKLYKNYYK